jgi:hypothetical protein
MQALDSMPPLVLPDAVSSKNSAEKLYQVTSDIDRFQLLPLKIFKLKTEEDA